MVITLTNLTFKQARQNRLPPVTSNINIMYDTPSKSKYSRPILTIVTTYKRKTSNKTSQKSQLMIDPGQVIAK